MALHLDTSTPSPQPGVKPSRWWSMVTALLSMSLFGQAVFAGCMLSGLEWARRAHAANAVFLVAVTLMASLVAIATLRRMRNGLRLGLTLLALAGAVFGQFALGKLAAKGVNLMWIHVPLGVALIALAGQAARAVPGLVET